jgi:hypothetical protein
LGSLGKWDAVDWRNGHYPVSYAFAEAVCNWRIKKEELDFNRQDAPAAREPS